MLAVGTHSKGEIVVSAAVGVVAWKRTYEAVKLGRTVALSNKEVLVAAGRAGHGRSKQSRAGLLPVDSEHNAVHQCLRGGTRSEVRRLVLRLRAGHSERHHWPNWRASLPNRRWHTQLAHGHRITIDSATMMNKGFEVIEARWLFGMRLSRSTWSFTRHPRFTPWWSTRGRFRFSATWPHRHAHAHPICVNLSRACRI